MPAHHAPHLQVLATPKALVWLPTDPWRSHVRVYGMRDTRGCGLDESQRHNRFAAVPYCALHWFLEGAADTVSVGGRDVYEPLPRWAVSGCFNVPVATLNRGDVHAFSAVFLPEAFHALFGLDLSGLHNRVVDAADVLPPSAMRMMQAVAEAPDDARRQALIEAYLAEHAAPAPQSAWQHMRQIMGRGGERTGLSLATQLLGVGPRQVQRLFQRELGLSLRDFLLLQRTEFSLMQVCQKVRRGEPFNWAEQAMDAGYADQPHMVRDVKARTGRTPAQLAHDRLAHEADWMYRLDIPEALLSQAQLPDTPSKEGPRHVA
jgi:AraC-like DNA-binding protein